MPAAEGAVLPAPTEDDLAHINKAGLAEWLGIPLTTTTRKTALVAEALGRLARDPSLRETFYDRFAADLALHPCDVERRLSITRIERQRWIASGRLRVTRIEEVQRYGQILSVPFIDRRSVLRATPEAIARWREEDRRAATARRHAGARRATGTRARYRSLRREAMTRLGEAIESVRATSGETAGAAYALAFWTTLASRWAKGRARTSEARDRWYARKDRALRLLWHSPWARLMFYRPPRADRVEVTFCARHYEEFREERARLVEALALDFYATHRTVIDRCAACTVERERDYYSLYSLTLVFGQDTFQFHVPFPVGRAYLPSPATLPMVDESQWDDVEGPFRFGRPVTDIERIVYRERDVERALEQALADYTRALAQASCGR